MPPASTALPSRGDGGAAAHCGSGRRGLYPFFAAAGCSRRAALPAWGARAANVTTAASPSRVGANGACICTARSVRPTNPAPGALANHWRCRVSVCRCVGASVRKYPHFCCSDDRDAAFHDTKIMRFLNRAGTRCGERGRGGHQRPLPIRPSHAPHPPPARVELKAEECPNHSASPGRCSTTPPWSGRPSSSYSGASVLSEPRIPALLWALPPLPSSASAHVRSCRSTNVDFSAHRPSSSSPLGRVLV